MMEKRGLSRREFLRAGTGGVLGLAAMSLIGPDSSWTVILPGLLFASIGAGIINPTVSGLALSSAPAHMSGLAAGVNDTATVYSLEGWQSG